MVAIGGIADIVQHWHEIDLTSCRRTFCAVRSRIGAMGYLARGTWVDEWYDTASSGGRFVRQDSPQLIPRYAGHIGWSMSAPGQSRHFGSTPATSALASTPDISLRLTN